MFLFEKQGNAPDFKDWSSMTADDWVAFQKQSVLDSEHSFFQEKMMPEIKNSPGTIVYDLGCGDGKDSKKMAETIGKPVVGMDYNADFIRHATEQAKDVKDLTYKVQDLCADDAPAQMRSYAKEDDKIMWACLGNTLGIVPEYKKVIINVSKAMKPGERFFLVSHNSDVLEEKGYELLYKPVPHLVGEIDEEKSDLKNGIFISKTGYTSLWFSAAKLEEMVNELSEGTLKPVFTGKNEGLDSYTLFEKQ